MTVRPALSAGAQSISMSVVTGSPPGHIISDGGVEPWMACVTDALGDEIERVHAATYRLGLDQQYQFVDLTQGSTSPADSRAPLFWRGALGALTSGDIDAPCDRLWFVTPEVSEAFLDAWREAGCSGVPDLVLLP